MSDDIITTAAELDALPERTLAENTHTLIRKDINGWFTLSEVGGWFWWDSVAIAEMGPWTVLYRPDRPTPGVLPSRETLTLVARDVHLYDGGEDAAISGPHAQRIADAILALLPGRSEQDVREEAIRTFEDIYFGGSAETRKWVAAKVRERLGLPPRTDDRQEADRG